MLSGKGEGRGRGGEKVEEEVMGSIRSVLWCCWLGVICSHTERCCHQREIHKSENIISASFTPFTWLMQLEQCRVARFHSALATIHHYVLVPTLIYWHIAVYLGCLDSIIIIIIIIIIDLYIMVAIECTGCSVFLVCQPIIVILAAVLAFYCG